MKTKKGSKALDKLSDVAKYPIFQDTYGDGFANYDNVSFESFEELVAYISQEYKSRGE